MCAIFNGVDDPLKRACVLPCRSLPLLVKRRQRTYGDRSGKTGLLSSRLAFIFIFQ